MRIANLISGGVDSSVALYLIEKAGYTTTAFYLKIWMEDDLFTCPWQEDLTFAKAVTKKLGVKLEVISMQKEYWEKIISYTLQEVKKGNTPNPDVFCNTFIKFGLFDEKYGRKFDKIATGHYARLVNSKQLSVNSNNMLLRKAQDSSKDQAYFLPQLTVNQLNRCLFPIGKLFKKEVRGIAKKVGLVTHNRPDSQGLCFLGKVNFRNFLQKYIGVKRGKIIDMETGEIVGQHEGHWFYTIGQREGLKIGGTGKPYYVVDKNAVENLVFVVKGRNNPCLYRDKITLTNLNILAPEHYNIKKDYSVQLRYHSAEVKGKIVNVEKQSKMSLKLEKPYFAVAPGQIGVLYDEDIVVASGIIT